MIKRILLPLEPSPYTDVATEYALLIAKEHEAEITGLAVLDIPGIEKSEGAVPLGGIYYAQQVIAHKQEDAREKIATLLKVFGERCQEAGVSYRLAEEQGAPVKRIVELSLYYDLVVMGLRTNYRFETKEGVEKSVEEILDHTITPVLAVPNEFRAIQNVTVAFDGSLPAARALQRFAHLALVPNLNITLLNSNEDKDEADRILDRAAEYLRAYGATSLRTRWSSERIYDVLVSSYLDTADMIVLGAHGKAGLLEFVMGGLPKKLIEFGKIPLFLGQ
jgi:nucleotide-binding universal stress UspA family protein